MNIVVFTGPSLRADEAVLILPAKYCPPAAFGDVYRAAQSQPTAIAIIDGYFENQPAIWHKEILWAMKNGIHVFGAASMGALRAAELAPFGMTGVGRIFKAFQSGELEDDDEVAIAHGPGADGYCELSVAMVDIRQTLRAAVEAQVLEPSLSIRLRDIAKALNFRERNYARMLREARARGVPEAALEPFRAWLPEGKVQQKRMDALELLHALRAWAELGPEPKAVDFSFARTDAWETASRRIAPHATVSEELAAEEGQAMEELRICGEYPSTLLRALNRALAINLCSRMGHEPDTEAMGRALDELRTELKIADDSAFARWMQEQDLHESALVGFARDEACLRWCAALFGSAAKRRVDDTLRALGERGILMERAELKQRLLEGWAGASTTDPDAGQPETVVDWYFSECLGIDKPDDLPGHARAGGFSDQEALLHSIFREHEARRRGLPPF